MVIEPPGEPGRAGIFEVDDRIFIAVKNALLEGFSGGVGHAGIRKCGLGIDALPVKARKNGRRGRAIETFIVEANSHLHETPSGGPRLTNWNEMRKASKNG